MGFFVGLLIVVVATTTHGATTCTSPYRDGGKPSAEALTRMLAAHAAWQHNATATHAERANLCGADLREARLTRQNLAWSNLQGAMLSRAYLGGANLRGANLQHAELTDALLGEANLQGANLQQTSLRKAYLVDANLQRAVLRGTVLQGATLTSADLSQADLEGADLQRANMKHATLWQVRLAHANLQEANLWNVDLQQAMLAATNLSGANLGYAKLSAAVFEPPLEALPSISRLAEAYNLSQLTFRTSPHAFVAVREAFRKAGLHPQARAMTFALNRGLRQQAPLLEQVFRWLFFELTYQYGMSPLRPLSILVLLTPGFAISYMITLWCYRRRQVSAARAWRAGLRQAARVSWIGLALSALSLLPLRRRRRHIHIKIMRETALRHRIRMRGWARVTTGLQDIINVYLLLLWMIVTLRMSDHLAWFVV